MKIKKLGALLVSAALCAGMAAPAFAFEGDTTPVEQPVLPEVVEDVVTVTDEASGVLPLLLRVKLPRWSSRFCRKSWRKMLSPSRTKPLVP